MATFPIIYVRYSSYLSLIYCQTTPNYKWSLELICFLQFTWLFCNYIPCKYMILAHAVPLHSGLNDFNSFNLWLHGWITFRFHGVECVRRGQYDAGHLAPDSELNWGDTLTLCGEEEVNRMWWLVWVTILIVNLGHVSLYYLIPNN